MSGRRGFGLWVSFPAKRRTRNLNVVDIRCTMKGMEYGYARVSTDDQNPALQLAALKKAGCRTVFRDEGQSDFGGTSLAAVEV